MDEPSLRIAKKIKIVTVSNFVKQMLEEIGIPVAGVPIWKPVISHGCSTIQLLGKAGPRAFK
ncbi:MAG: hypothetical protein QW128_06330 [Thermoprotei archaeon]